MQHNTVTANISKPVSQRLVSLDALRGFDMFWIVSGEGIFHGFANGIMKEHGLVRNPENWQIAITGNLQWWEKVLLTISNQLHHSPWNGFTFYDLIFPLFIFIAGVSMPYSIGGKLAAAGNNRKAAKKEIYRSLIKRTILLILFGMVVNGALQLTGYENTRFASVLGRIALSCFFAAVIFLNFSLRGQIIWFAALLLGYWAIMSWVPVPGFGAGVFTPEGNLSAYFDRLFLPGKPHRKVYDPEGLLSTLPAIGSALLGVFTGWFLKWQHASFSKLKKAYTIALTGILLLGCGWLWGHVFPVNKNMWTSSFVLVAGGYSLLLLAVFYLVIDVAGLRKWSLPFVWVGMNSIIIYIAAHGVFNFEHTSQFIFGGIIHFFNEKWQEALVWIGVALIQFGLMYFLYKKKIFFKL